MSSYDVYPDCVVNVNIMDGAGDVGHSPKHTVPDIASLIRLAIGPVIIVPFDGTEGMQNLPRVISEPGTVGWQV